MRLIALAGLIVAAGVAAAQQVTMNLTIAGKPFGTIVLTRSFIGKTMVERSALTTTSGTAKGSKMTLETHIDPNGVTTKKTMSANARGRSGSATAILSNTGAKITAVAQGKTRTQTIPIGQQASRKDVSAYWFVKTKPAVGAKASYRMFDITNLRWLNVTSTYRGQKTVKVKGKSVKAHHIEQSMGGEVSNLYVDDRGMPWLIEDPNARYERK